MAVFIFILFIFIGGLFGWFCGDIINAIKEKDSRRSWLGWLIFLLGFIYMMIGSWQVRYNYNHRQYDYDEYEIVNDTTIVNHNGQIDTIATFKIVEK